MNEALLHKINCLFKHDCMWMYYVRFIKTKAMGLVSADNPVESDKRSSLDPVSSFPLTAFLGQALFLPKANNNNILITTCFYISRQWN